MEKRSAQRLLGPGALAFLMLAAGVIAVVVAEKYLASTRLDRQSAAEERRSAQEKLSRATSEEREIREKLVDYRGLLARGVIGDEQRLDWVETIARIKDTRKIPDIRYNIAPQRAFDLPGVAPGGDVEFRVSELRLNMQVLHEEDVLNVIDDLQRLLKTHVMVRSCRIDRADRTAADRGAAARLRAECVLDLVTIRDRKLKTA
jgi:hypothetical protein